MPKQPRTIITPDQFDQVYTALPSDTARLMAEVLIESGPRWAELIELRPIDLNPRLRMLTVSRVAVELVAKFHPTGGRFLIKDYPKDREHRRVKLAAHIAEQLPTHIADHGLAHDDLLSTPTLLRIPVGSSHLRLVAGPVDLGLTEPNAAGRQYRHGTLTGYNPGGCKCQHCRGAYAKYRAERRAAGKDPHPAPRTTRSRTLTTDGHVPRSWFREHIWEPALDSAGIGIRVRTHDLRHPHASWLLAGGADLQTVKERLGRGGIITTGKYLHTLAETDDTALTAVRQRKRVKQGGRAPAQGKPGRLTTHKLSSRVTDLPMLDRAPGIAGLRMNLPPRRNASAALSGYHAGYRTKIIDGDRASRGPSSPRSA